MTITRSELSWNSILEHFLSHRDLHVNNDLTLATKFWQPWFFRIAIFSKKNAITFYFYQLSFYISLYLALFYHFF